LLQEVQQVELDLRAPEVVVAAVLVVLFHYRIIQFVVQQVIQL
jgi:hypothetical protein